MRRMNEEPVTISSVGMGGYAFQVLDQLMRHETGPSPTIRLRTVFEPDLTTHAKSICQLRAQGIKVVDHYQALLEDDSEAVWLPIPIHLHREFTEQALASKKVVMVEKPAAGTVNDIDGMIAARDRSGLAVAVGFQDIYDQSISLLKKRLLDGVIGSIESISLIGCWPRSTSYYSRNNWAGTNRRDGRWVLDSPANNALAHFLNLAVFLAGDNLNTSALPLSIESELYRVNRIESYDTCAFRAALSNDAQLIVFLTHACNRTIHPRIAIRGSAGQMRWNAFSHAQIEGRFGTERITLGSASASAIIPAFAKLVRRGYEPSVDTFATLEQARIHTTLINGASQSRAVVTLSERFTSTALDSSSSLRYSIQGIEELFEACIKREQLPHESGLAPWTSPPGQCDLRGYRDFSGLPASEYVPSGNSAIVGRQPQ